MVRSLFDVYIETTKKVLTNFEVINSKFVRNYLETSKSVSQQSMKTAQYIAHFFLGNEHDHKNPASSCCSTKGEILCCCFRDHFLGVLPLDEVPFFLKMENGKCFR